MNKVVDALKIVDEQAISINFNSVANFTGVTKAWLYKQPPVKEHIQQARSTANNLLMRDQAAKLCLKNKEIDILTKQNKHIRQQITKLKQQLEMAYAAIYN